MGFAHLLGMGGPIGDMARAAAEGLCPFCGEKPGEFRDEDSRRESAISGLCQPCQDGMFGKQ